MNINYLMPCILLPALVAAWDIAVVTDDEIEFLQYDRLVGVVGDYLKELLSATFDPVKGDLYVSDCNQPNASIFKISMLSSSNSSSQAIGFQPVVSKQPSVVQGVTFDSVTTTLFWSTGNGHTINKLPHINNSYHLPEMGEVLHQFTDEIPQGIAVDSCRQYLYWTNCNHLKPSIERSLFDGTNKEIIIRDKLFQPLGISVDQQMKKIFWSDEREGIYYSIERSNLDGSGRETLIHGTHHQPFAITVDAKNVYWSDWINKALWSLPKDSVNGGIEPQVLKRFNFKTPLGVMSNVIYDTFTDTDCYLMSQLKHQVDENMSKWTVPTVKSTHIKKHDSIKMDLLSNVCLNNGTILPNDTCQCVNGFSGLRCEISVCRNYCLTGACHIDQLGNPYCNCSDGRTGARCENNVCDSACLNNGKCSSDKGNKIFCKCKPGYFGERCQFTTELCLGYCKFLAIRSRNLDTSIDQSDSESDNESHESIICSCSKFNKSSINSEFIDANDRLMEQSKMKHEQLVDSRVNVVITSCLGVLCVILLIAVLFLTTKLCSMNKRPRIRKRIVVSKAAPLTCRPQSPPDQCEITIENCCNMNICETPCFEPEYRSKSTFNKSKSEDKKILIDNMRNSISSQEEDIY